MTLYDTYILLSMAAHARNDESERPRVGQGHAVLLITRMRLVDGPMIAAAIRLEWKCEPALPLVSTSRSTKAMETMAKVVTTKLLPHSI